MAKVRKPAKRKLSYVNFVPADRYTLQFDLDTGEAVTFFWKQVRFLSCMMAQFHQSLRAVSLTRSRANWHAEIKLSKPKSIIERIALQSMLGSDRTRELCNWERWNFGSQYPILFWSRNNASLRVDKPKRKNVR